MSEQEKIDELLDLSHTIARRQRVNTALCVIVLLIVITACCFAGYKLTQITAQFQESIADLNTIKEEVNSFFDSFQAAGYETPEQAIQDLHNITESINGILKDIEENGILGLGSLGSLPGLGDLGENALPSLEEGSDVLNQAMEWLGGLFGSGKDS